MSSSIEIDRELLLALTEYYNPGRLSLKRHSYCWTGSCIQMVIDLYGPYTIL